ncbi:tyrosine-type recombinase/integrase [Chloroflexota bacterium]
MEKKQKSAVLNSGSFEVLLEDYSMSLKALNRSQKTIDWYMDNLKNYFSFLSNSNMLKSIKQLGSQELKAYLLHLKERDRWPKNKYIKNKGRLSPFSIQAVARAIKAFWSWLLKDGIIEENPLAKFPLPKVPQNLIQTITVPDMKKLFEKIDRYSSAGERLYCMLMLLIDTGVRVGELVNIRMSDVDFAQGLITITMGKGQKQRQVPFYSITRKAILKYIDGARTKLSSAESDYVFVDQYGDHVSISSVQQAIRRLAKKAGLAKCHPHLLRHTFASMYIADNGPTFILKELMGHQSILTTEKYIHLKTQDLKMQHKLHSPLKDIFKQE